VDSVINELQLRTKREHKGRDQNQDKNSTNLEGNFPEEAVSGRPNPQKEDSGVNRSKKGTIEPSSTLRNEFGNLEGDMVSKLNRREYHLQLTVVGTSVDALALLTYFKLRI
jgi:hypothetical protein